jgi:hypothetical protein
MRGNGLFDFRAIVAPSFCASFHFGSGVAQRANFPPHRLLMGHMRPWRQARPYWDYAAALVLKAATTGRRKDVAAATDQMERALRTDNWL